ncbi:hypothetical protein HMPREF0290_1422 [Corynebacterium efficiens YS-314]|nr:hypothetical protein [Corynebacterium efficiens]EEW50008.1 hypothetical protein HMPREF0290_1422 [Corynebacterium efficiens YS-314]
MNLRRTLAVAAASVMALTATIAPAQAQNADIVSGINNLIDTFDCDLLRTGLTQTGLVTPETTRSELAATLRTTANLGEIDVAFAFVGSAYAGRIADRAQTCGIVQPDPEQDILTQLQNLSSNLSS